MDLLYAMPRGHGDCGQFRFSNVHALSMRAKHFAPVLLWLLLTSPQVNAHDIEAVQRATAPVLTWTFDSWVVVPLVLSAALYGFGVLRLWRRAGQGRGLGAMQVGAFVAGWLALVFALVSPLDALGAQSFSAHMVQHEILMLVAAPLFVISRPLAAWTWALSPAWRHLVGRATRQSHFAWTWTALTAPLSAWILHALALWVWHAPALFNASLVDEAVHTLQHASFVASALLFWWAVIGRDARSAPGVAILSLLTTMIHTGVLGALMAFAPSVWYAPYLERAPLLGLDPLADQQLGGLIMWVPAGAVYLVVAILLAMRWLNMPLNGREPDTA